ncbi:hypothetical protein [Hyphomicrobium sp.]|uniref:hypothetical protein n=1 Tax=Hyphomicrobium sp. TaxID=82 RepID=UPI001D8E8072|nr:hypothetical protein [Hyphomicrobium sp.]MBY0561463.1 hypothetical protein [Hyphomicrobium sp.]
MTNVLARKRATSHPAKLAIGFENLSLKEMLAAEKKLKAVLDRPDISGAQALSEIRKIVLGLKTPKVRTRRLKPAKTKAEKQRT